MVMIQTFKPAAAKWVQCALNRVAYHSTPLYQGWTDTPPIAFNQQSDRLIVTIAIGQEFQDLLAVTGPLLKAYALNVGADFHVITDKTQNWWGFEKFRIRPMVEAYDRTLFIDADCIVRPHCRDVFSYVPVDKIGIRDDLPDNERHWANIEWLALMASQGLKRPFLERLLNTGVVVCSKQHASIWTPPARPIPCTHCDEQFWIDHNIDCYGHQVLPFPLELNHQFWNKEFFNPALLHKAEIIHLADCRVDRLGYARRFAGCVC